MSIRTTSSKENSNKNTKFIKNIVLWNCNKIENKIEELFYTLDNEDIDIIALNETKLEKNYEASILNHPNYNYVVKSRNKYGGGVSFIIKKNIKYEVIEDLNKFEVEAICVKLIIKNKEVYVITYYNPPNGKDIDKTVFEFIEKNYKNYIICGDFNSKHVDFGCKVTNKNGSILNEIINSSNAVILNKKDEFTYYRERSGYKEILDLVICSSSLYSCINGCYVDYDLELQSDHIPVKLNFKNLTAVESEELCDDKHINYAKANWKLFKEELDLIDTREIMKNKNANEINNFFVESINRVSEKTLPYKTNNLKNNIRLPKYIIDLINTRRKMKKKLTKNQFFNNKEMWSQFYIINKTIREEIKAVKNQQWASFIDKIGKNPLSSKAVWRKIQIIKNNGNKKADNYPILIHDNKKYDTDETKANLFAELLGETFKDNEKDKYDDKFKRETNKNVEDYVNNSEYGEEIKSINIKNLNTLIKNLKSKLSCGVDKVSNIMLKNLSEKFKLLLIHLCKTTVTSLVIPELWKKVIVRMIPKKNDGKKDPKNYRPISITSCIARLCERFILIEINDHLKKHKLIIKQQSGFRSYRQTKDNIFAICQRNLEAFNSKKKNCVIFFDISKAFDKIWQNGLLFKMKSLKFKDSIIKWLYHFLKGRSFTIKINKNNSNYHDIETGVPQGGVLSPILFSIFINDIIDGRTVFKKNEVHSNMFADDLASSCASNKSSLIEQTMNIFLNKLENWLYKWRLDMNPKKCQYIVFGKGLNRNPINLKLKLFNELIPKANSIKFLGVTLDYQMSFNDCVNEIITKCNGRLNILKILANKSWCLSSDTLKCVYFSLIRSIIEYNSIIFPLISETNKKKLRAIQYKALIIAFRKPFKTRNNELLLLSKATNLDDRIEFLNKRYFENCLKHENELITDIIKNYKNWYTINRECTYKTVLCFYRKCIEDENDAIK
jgi:hypothetical protein